VPSACLNGYCEVITNSGCGFADSHLPFKISQVYADKTLVLQLCERLGVRLLVDAEYTYLNPALRLLSLAAMMTYNTRAPLVAFTYQNYLKVTPALTHSTIFVETPL